MPVPENDIIIEADLQILNGDFNIFSANEQNIKHILISSPGNFLLTPSLGVDIYRQQNASFVDWRPLVSKIKSELKKDGYDNTKISGVADNKTDKSSLNVLSDRITIAKRQTI